MKNVTITMDDATADWVRIEAAKRNTSMSRLIGEFVADRMRQDDAYERAMREALAFRPVPFESATGARAFPGRDEIYAERLDRFR